MKKTRRFATLSLGMLLSLGVVSVSAASSGNMTTLVPRMGQMSSAIGNIEKETTSVPGTMYLNTAPHTFTLYGDYAKPGTGQNIGPRLSDDYYALKLRNNVKIYSGDIKAGTYVGGRVGSSNLELDERYVTFGFNPN